MHKLRVCHMRLQTPFQQKPSTAILTPLRHQFWLVDTCLGLYVLFLSMYTTLGRKIRYNRVQFNLRSFILLDFFQRNSFWMQVITEAAEAGNPILFFCRVGKDRTGVLAALLLSCCGAEPQEIIADYHRYLIMHACHACVPLCSCIWLWQH